MAERQVAITIFESETEAMMWTEALKNQGYRACWCLWGGVGRWSTPGA